MTATKRTSYGPKIALMTVVLIAVTGLAMNVDAILGPPAEPVAPAETPTEAPVAVEGHGIDFAMEDHYTKVVLEQSTATLLADAVNELPPLPETWSREDLQRDEGYVEDEDEAEYYSELDQLNSVLRTASAKERAALTALFETRKSRPTTKAEVVTEAGVKPKSKLTLRPNAAVIKRKSKTSKPSTPKRTVAESKPKPKPAAAPVEPAKATTEAPKEASGPTIDPNASAKELITLGRRLLLSGDPTNAERAYRLALKKSSTSARARYGLAKALYQKNRVRDAIGELGRILKGNQNHGSALLMMGSLLQERGQTGEARKYYQRYLDTHPNGRRADEIRSILARL